MVLDITTTTSLTTSPNAGKPKRITMHNFPDGTTTGNYYCGKPRGNRRVHKTQAWAMEAAGEAVLQDCVLCGIVVATMDAGR